MSLANATSDPAAAFACSTCQATFENNAAQRLHFKSASHVTKIRQQAKIPPLNPLRGDRSYDMETLAALEVQIGDPDQLTRDTNLQGQMFNSTSLSDKEHAQKLSSHLPFEPSRCLLCIENSPDLDGNLLHMQKVHGLSIPDQDHLIDAESFIAYLYAVVFHFNECLYCGTVKDTVQGIQQHMLAKGHCKIEDLTEGSDYLDFYDFTNSEHEDEDDTGFDKLKAPKSNRGELLNSTDGYVFLPSGRTLGDRSTLRSVRHELAKDRHEKVASRQEIRNADVASSSEQDDTEAKSKGQLIVRSSDERGLTGLADWQRHAMGVTQKKIMKAEIRARNRYEAAVQKAANRQKYFKPDVPGPTNG